MAQQKGTKKEKKPAKKKPNLVGWSFTDITQRQVQKMAAKFRVKKVQAIYKIFDILFNELSQSRDFKKFVEMYDTLQSKEVPAETSIYSSFDIEPEYMERFKDTMYRFDYVDRSPFLRIVIDYIYLQYSEPLTDVLEKLEADITEKGYRVKNITPALMGDIFIHIESPLKTGSASKKKSKK